MTDVNLIIQMMDDRDVDLSVLTQTNPHILWAPPAFGLKLARAINDATSALHVKYPKRFLGAIILPMQDVLVGVERVVCGTDFPQGMGIMKPVDYVEAIPGITKREAEMILCENPARLLRV